MCLIPATVLIKMDSTVREREREKERFVDFSSWSFLKIIVSFLMYASHLLIVKK